MANPVKTNFSAKKKVPVTSSSSSAVAASSVFRRPPGGGGGTAFRDAVKEFSGSTFGMGNAPPAPPAPAAPPSRVPASNDVIFGSCDYFSMVNGGMKEKMKTTAAAAAVGEEDHRRHHDDDVAGAAAAADAAAATDRERDRSKDDEKYEKREREPERDRDQDQDRDRDRDRDRNRDRSSRRDDDEKKSQVQAALKAEIDLEKQGYLTELRKFKDSVTREFTMDDSLEDIQFEFDRIKTQIDTSNNVNMIRDGLMFLFQGIEYANRRFGPVLQLDGWSDAAREEKPKYNLVIERLYKKHWRYGNMTPEAEFGWMIGSSMLMCHFKNKLMGGGGSGAAAAPKKAGGNGGGGVDLASLMTGMLPKFSGLNPRGGAAPPPPPREQRATSPSAMPPLPTASRPIMRGPSLSSSSSSMNGPLASTAALGEPLSRPSGVPIHANFFPMSKPSPTPSPPPPATTPSVVGGGGPDVSALLQSHRDMQEQFEQQRAEMNRLRAELQAATQKAEALASVAALVAPTPASPSPQTQPIHNLWDTKETSSSSSPLDAADGKQISIVGSFNTRATPGRKKVAAQRPMQL